MFKNKELLSIFIVVFVDLLGFSIILPLLPFYATTFAASPEMIGILVASYSVCQFFAAPVLGGLSDKYGRRPLLIYSQIGSMIGFIMLGLAHSLPMLFASRIIDGVSGGNLTIAQAFIADVTKPEDRSSSMAVIGIAFGLGFMIGPAIGGTMAHNFGYSAPAYLAAFFALCSTLLTTFFLKEHQHVRDENSKMGLGFYIRAIGYFKDRSLRTLLTIFLFFALPFSLYVSMASLFLKMRFDFNEQQVGYFLFFVGFAGAIYQGGVIRPLVKRIGEVRAMQIGMVALCLGLLGIVFATDWHGMALVALVFAFGTGVVRPTLSSLVSQAAPPNRKGGVLGASSSIESASRSVAPVIGGLILGGLHPNYLGIIGGLLAAIGMAFAFTIPRSLGQGGPESLRNKPV